MQHKKNRPGVLSWAVPSWLKCHVVGRNVLMVSRVIGGYHLFSVGFVFSPGKTENFQYGYFQPVRRWFAGYGCSSGSRGADCR